MERCQSWRGSRSIPDRGGRKDRCRSIRGAGVMREGEQGAGTTGSRSVRRAAIQGRPSRGRIAPGDLATFRRNLDAATRRSIVTPILVLISGACFAAMVWAGGPIHWPSAREMVHWGANDGGRLILRHEYWRLLACVFLHGGILHLIVNMWGLLMIGPLVERIHGHLAFGVIYLASGIGGAIASAATPPIRVSVGASGAICGVLGGLLAFLVRHHRAIPRTVLAHLTRNLTLVVALMAVLGVLVANMAVLGAAVADIDQAAHLGGLATGFVCGFLLIGPWPVPPGSRHRLLVRRLAITVLIAAALGAAAFVVAHRDVACVSPSRRLDDLVVRIAPAVREVNAIRKDLAREAGRDESAEDVPDDGAAVAALGKLRARAQAVAGALVEVRHAASIGDDPDLLAIVDDLSCAVDALAARIGALEHYFSTGERSALNAAREALATSIEANRRFEDDRRRFLVRHGLEIGRP